MNAAARFLSLLLRSCSVRSCQAACCSVVLAEPSDYRHATPPMLDPLQGVVAGRLRPLRPERVLAKPRTVLFAAAKTLDASFNRDIENGTRKASHALAIWRYRAAPAKKRPELKKRAFRLRRLAEAAERFA
jgi:hypothetical protein